MDDHVSAAAADYDDDDVVVDNDNFDRQHLYRFVRVLFWALLHHDFVDMNDQNYVIDYEGVIGLDDDGMNFVHKSFDLLVM